ncbi:MAG: sensor histidine kinase [Poseidonibacter sp.]|uniref:sensor histidine kinase n=1 Tax=Poseidonibacter sp. TaxID=2321188 RepID=UPI00359D47A3
MQKKFYRLTTIVIFLIISISTVIFTSDFIIKKEKEFLEKKYKNIAMSIHDKINSLILKKKNSTLALTITLANNNYILDKLNNIATKDKLKELSLLLREQTDFKNVWFHVLDNKGVSLYRSWTDHKNDSMINKRNDIAEMIKNPKIQSTISVGKYDISFKAMVPIYENDKFIGILESITHFNSISKSIRESSNVEPIIVVQKEYTKQLKEKSFTNIFLQDHYIANLSVNKNLIKRLDNEDFESLLNVKDYIIKDNSLLINTPIIYNNKKLASFIVCKEIDKIDLTYIENYKRNMFLYLALFIIVLGLVLYIISYYLYSKELKKVYTKLDLKREELANLNDSLKQTVEEEVSKNNEKNNILFQQSKMAAMGEMIGNIAHQWRQPLSLITTAASGMKLKKEFGMLSDDEYKSSLNSILGAANHLSSTIEDFRNFFSPIKEKNSFISNDLVEKVFKLLGKEYSNKNIKIVKNIQDFEIYSFENELLQVIINLLNNSRDELIKIEDISKRFIFIDLLKENENFILRVKDTANGIPLNIMERIFEPYFTTKHKSMGTGIGLYMTQEIVEKHLNGKILVSNETFTYEDQTFKGALFELRIPIENE